MKRRKTIVKELNEKAAEQDKLDAVAEGLFTAYKLGKIERIGYENLLKAGLNSPQLFLYTGTEKLKECRLW